MPATPLNRLPMQPRWWVTVQLPLARVGSRSGQGSPTLPLPGGEGSGTVEGPQQGEHCALPRRSMASLLGESGLPNTAMGPSSKEKTPLSCTGHRDQGLQVHATALGGETGSFLRASTCQPTEKGPASQHQARPMTSPAGARELPAHGPRPLLSSPAARTLMLHLLGRQLRMCWAEAGYHWPRDPPPGSQLPLG